MTNILLVEDNEMNSDMLTRRLVRAGYAVEVAMDGAAALTGAMRLKPDVILMDLGLPVIDGFEVTRQLKADPQLQTIPIIALTAHALAGDCERALTAGCDDYATKPIDFSGLMEKINRLTMPQ